MVFSLRWAADQDAAAAVLVPLFIMLGAMVPGGWVVSDQALEPKLSRMSPAKNLGRLFSGKHALNSAISIGKAAVLIAVLIHVAAPA
jgi:flagellar biosynthetic protein FlhB